MRRAFAVTIGFVAIASAFAIGAGGASGSGDRILAVTPRAGECVQAGFVTYGSLDLRGAPTAMAAAARYAQSATLRERAYAPSKGSVIEVIERNAVVAAFRTENLDGKQWVVTEYQRSAPCGSEDRTMFTVPYDDDGPAR